MMKVLLTLAIVVLALLWWFGKGRGGGAASRKAKPVKAAKAVPALTMVSCAHCGLHLPQPDAVEGEGGRHYCSSEHRRLGPGPRA
jgi:uncharacterized protein